MSWTMNFDSEGLLIVVIYIWLPLASYVVFLTTLVLIALKWPFKLYISLQVQKHLTEEAQRDRKSMSPSPVSSVTSS